MKVGDLVILSEGWQQSGFLSERARSGIIVDKLSGSSNGTCVSVLWSSGELTERCPIWMLEDRR